MKKLFTVVLFAMVALAAFASPKPSDIENALAAKNYSDAKGMITEVLREHPESARAHLLNAYILIHADRNKVAANAELQTAVGLDKKGDVRSSPLFGRTVAEIDMVKSPVVKQAIAARIAHDEPDYWLMLTLGFFVLLAIVIGYALSGRRETLVYMRGEGGGYGLASNGPNPQSPSSGGGFYPSAHTTVYQSAGPQSSGMGAMGTAASVAGGVVAGSLLSEALLHNHHSSRRDYDREESSYTSAPAASAYEPSPVSYSNERSSYDSSSSSSDSWGSSDSSSSSSSDW